MCQLEFYLLVPDWHVAPFRASHLVKSSIVELLLFLTTPRAYEQIQIFTKTPNIALSLLSSLTLPHFEGCPRNTAEGKLRQFCCTVFPR